MRVLSENSSVLLAVVGYFVYITATFTVMIALLIGLTNHSTIGELRRYPRPVIEATTVTARLTRNFAILAKVRNRPSTARMQKASPSPLAEGAQSRDRSRPARLPEPIPQREGSGRDYALAPGSAGGFGYGTGLAIQR